MAHLLNWSGHFLENLVFSLTKNRKSQIRLFHNNVKNQISIRVFHWVCQFGFFTPVSIRVFAPYPLSPDWLIVRTRYSKPIKTYWPKTYRLHSFLADRDLDTARLGTASLSSAPYIMTKQTAKALKADTHGTLTLLVFNISGNMYLLNIRLGSLVNIRLCSLITYVG